MIKELAQYMSCVQSKQRSLASFTEKIKMRRPRTSHCRITVTSIVVLATTRHLPSSGRFWPTCHLDPVSGSLKDSNGEVTVIS